MLRDGFQICFYMSLPGQAVAQAAMRSLEAFLRAVGPQTLRWYVDLEGDLNELDARSWETTRHNLLGSHWPRIALLDDDSGATGFQFEYYNKPLETPHPFTFPDMVSSVGFWLPTEFLESHGPGFVRELVLELAAPLPFNSGHAGFAFNGMLGYRETAEELSRLCLRYPGMDILKLESLTYRLGTRVKGPAWMTFLGPPVLGELGGTEGLRARLSSPGTRVQQLEGDRAVITLGPWPEAGDTHEGRTLPQYRELARLLEPWLYHSRGPWPYFPEDIRQRWERRFLD